jgi:hypothetical protein
MPAHAGNDVQPLTPCPTLLPALGQGSASRIIHMIHTPYTKKT